MYLQQLQQKSFFFRFLVKFFYAFQFYAFRLSGFATIFPRSGVYDLGCCHLHIASWCVLLTEANNSVA